MKVRWEYDLPASEEPKRYDYEFPIHVRAGKVFFATQQYTFESPGRGTFKITVHAVNTRSGVDRPADVEFPSTVVKLSMYTLPSEWAFVPLKSRLLLYCGRLVSAEDEPRLLPALPHLVARAFIVHRGRLLFADEASSTLYSYDLENESIAWTLSLKNSVRYRVGAPQIFDGQIVCSGRDHLNFIDPDTGSIQQAIALRGIDNLFWPIADGTNLLLGYTNWSVGGVLKLERASGKILWQHRRKFQGPASYRKIWRFGETIVWVKGETELVGIDAQSGSEKWAYRPGDWIYASLLERDGRLIVGTGGRNEGSLQALDPATGKVAWRVKLADACSSFDTFKDSLVVGDLNGIVRRIDTSSGKIHDRLDVGGAVVGSMLVHGASAYTVISCNDKQPPRLISIKLN